MRKAFGLVFVVMLLAVPVLAAAQVQGPPEGAMLIILDASGSMNNLDENGVPFIDKAEDAVLELVDALPDGMNVGLRVYGHREPNTDAVRGCQDTELVRPLHHSTEPRSEMRSKVSRPLVSLRSDSLFKRPSPTYQRPGPDRSC
jgi:hypothetical protein